MTDGSVTEGLVSKSCFHGAVRSLDPEFKKGRRKRYVKKQIENVLIGKGVMSRDEPISEVNFVGIYRNG